MPKFLLLISLLLIILVSTGGAEETPWMSSRTAFEAGFGARTLGMGHILIGPDDCPGSVVYNPSALGFATRGTLEGGLGFLSDNAWGGSVFGLSSGTAISKFLRIPDLGGYFAVAGLATQVTNRRHSDHREVLYDESLWLGQVSYGRRIGRNISLGAGAKINRAHVFGDAELGAGLDFGLSWAVRPDWLIGAAVRDINLTEIECLGIDVSPPWNWAAGLAYKPSWSHDTWTASATANLVQFDGDDVRLRLGGELLFPEIKGVRGAMRTGYNGEGITLGGGFRIAFVELNYAFARLEEADFLDDYGHTVSLSISPGKLLKWGESSSGQTIADYRWHQYLGYRAAADRARTRGDYGIAHDNYLRAGTFADTSHQVLDLEQSSMLMQDRIDDLETTNRAALVRTYQDSLDLYRREYGDSLETLRAEIVEHRATRHNPATLVEQRRQYLSEGEAFLANGQYYLALGRASLVLEDEPEHSPALELMERTKAEIEKVLLAEIRRRTPGDVLSELDSMFVERITTNTAVPDSVVSEWYQQGRTFNLAAEYQKAIDVWQLVYKARPNHPSVVEDIEAARRRLEAEE